MVENAGAADPFDLKRFLDAQADSYEQACLELAGGRKRSHWMWFVFPQMRGLGHSAMAHHFGISSIEEARAFLEHPLLGPRLRYAAELLLKIDGQSAHEILGSPDDLKLRSSMTLFARASLDNQPFVAVLGRYFNGEEDPATLSLIDPTGA